MLAINVHSNVNSSMSHIPRGEMLAWVNDSLQASFKKIEELRTGAAYCQFMDMLFSGSIMLKRVKFNTNIEYDFIQNFKLLQAAFKFANIDKYIPIDSLTKGRYQDNFEFLQWFIKFFERNKPNNIDDYDALKARNGAVMGFGIVTKRTRSKNPSATMSSNSKPLTMRPRSLSTQSQTRASVENVRQCTIPFAVHEELLRRNEELERQLENSQLNYMNVEKEKNFYFAKLRSIEILCQDFKGDGKKFVNKTMNILYDTVEGFCVPNNSTGIHVSRARNDVRNSEHDTTETKHNSRRKKSEARKKGF